ncbi:hypothetical protein HANVADRAFT_46964 [Hanseniaspora valbyensis NRRL Y-1626]|uniref:Crh-like protein n=1 Tax=Hanseniaspora valbyensis NRRL Y-1626 TaxID=766949 RepID=A0A1B7TJ55_9ASCO|nr:hypothetical protein HANVADRAFT_46964 [Hanseniaspora valbyensis NRRL Y-1626]
MISKYLLMATFLTTFTQAYTTVCNPLEDSSCSPSNTALTDSPVTLNFTSNATVSKYFNNYSGTGELTYTDDGLNLTLAKRYDNPSIVSNFYLMFGRIEVIAKPAYGTGIVSTVYLQSDDLDEIDLEWVGTDTTHVQSNYYSKGNTTTYDRAEYNSLESNADLFTSVHNYTVDWTNEHVKWYIDGELVRTLLNTSSQGFPQTPMAIYVGVWAGGDPSNSEGTIEWAGGETDYNDTPFTMLLQSMMIENYSTGTSYTYSGTTGDWESIEAVDGKVLGALVDYSDSSSTTTTTTSASASSTATSTTSDATATSSSAATTTASTSSSSSIMVSSVVDASRTTTLLPASSSTQITLSSVTYVAATSSSNSSVSATATGNSTTLASSTSASSTATVSTSTQANSGSNIRATGGFSYNGNNKIICTMMVSLVALLLI